jgi:hypothetical protein
VQKIPHNGDRGKITEKLNSHYALADIKAAFFDPLTLNRSFVAKQGADVLDIDNSAVMVVIQALDNTDFDKSDI